jgi:hypothetical protein
MSRGKGKEERTMETKDQPPDCDSFTLPLRLHLRTRGLCTPLPPRQPSSPLAAPFLGWLPCCLFLNSRAFASLCTFCHSFNRLSAVCVRPCQNSESARLSSTAGMPRNRPACRRQPRRSSSAATSAAACCRRCSKSRKAAVLVLGPAAALRLASAASALRHEAAARASRAESPPACSTYVVGGLHREF